MISVRGGVTHMPNGEWRAKILTDLQHEELKYFGTKLAAWEWLRKAMERAVGDEILDSDTET